MLTDHFRVFWRVPARGILILLIFAFCLQMALMGKALAVANGQAPDHTQTLVGRWVRPDGGYILELREFHADGDLVATYDNRRPVHVAVAKWRQTTAGFDLYIELRDVNYPGSTYRLHYSPVNDRIQGIYFQAMYQQQYQVEFVRSR